MRRLITAVILLTTTLAGAQMKNDASPWGLASGAEWARDYPRFNPMLNDAGYTWLRIFDEWGWIQPSKDQWNWDKMDAKLADAKKNNLRLSGGLWYFAPWATKDGGTRAAPLKDINDWSNYVTAAVNRYKGDIKHWEVWNEYNGSFGKSLSGDKVQDYTDLFVAASKAAKAADPDAKVGLNCANFSLGFFDEVIKRGAAGHFDFICIHPYENVGMAMKGEEAAFLTMTASIRKMLAENKQNVNTPIWITEAGVLVSIEPNAESDQLQAEGLVKLNVLSMASGIERVFWFEARGPSYGHGVDHGLIRKDWSIRPAYTAMKTMTGLLGAEPKYVGWLDKDGCYGFVFANGDQHVLVTWAPPGEAKRLTVADGMVLVELTGAESKIDTNPMKVTPTPIWLKNLPEAWIAEARANGKLAFPWGGDFAKADVVNCRLSATNIDKGIKQIKPETTGIVHELAESYRQSKIHDPRLNNEGRYAYFRVDSAFAGFGAKDLEITVVAKRISPDKPATISLTYESLKGYKGAKDQWNIPAGEWQEKTWTVSDANFVGGWGWNFRTDASGSRNDFLIKEVRVKKVAK
jgi:hypothetical protein